ncbi:hypothetical protein [Actinokineospora iranica]|uniref:hypothetical protein n=1 Tax=Actinokineospora iranica TaxID=1271860 RepID=UPI000B859FC4|nr:hypothetical protein [Actinokineospora iranica]
MTIEKADLQVALEVPAAQTGGFLRTLVVVVAAVGAALGPVLTLSALPSGFPAWGGVAVVAGQLVVAVVAIEVARRGGQGQSDGGR